MSGNGSRSSYKDKRIKEMRRTRRLITFCTTIIKPLKKKKRFASIIIFHNRMNSGEELYL